MYQGDFFFDLYVPLSKLSNIFHWCPKESACTPSFLPFCQSLVYLLLQCRKIPAITADQSEKPEERYASEQIKQSTYTF